VDALALKVTDWATQEGLGLPLADTDVMLFGMTVMFLEPPPEPHPDTVTMHTIEVVPSGGVAVTDWVLPMNVPLGLQYHEYVAMPAGHPV
jgi:hypothetical protein